MFYPLQAIRIDMLTYIDKPFRVMGRRECMTELIWLNNMNSTSFEIIQNHLDP